jgi:hypothetical protein
MSNFTSQMLLAEPGVVFTKFIMNNHVIILRIGMPKLNKVDLKRPLYFVNKAPHTKFPS